MLHLSYKLVNCPKCQKKLTLVLGKADIMTISVYKVEKEGLPMLKKISYLLALLLLVTYPLQVSATSTSKLPPHQKIRLIAS